ncbi:hypothetical protein P7K49_024435, partial [Saguinus oedipus]
TRHLSKDTLAPKPDLTSGEGCSLPRIWEMTRCHQPLAEASEGVWGPIRATFLQGGPVGGTGHCCQLQVVCTSWPPEAQAPFLVILDGRTENNSSFPGEVLQKFQEHCAGNRPRRPRLLGPGRTIPPATGGLPS